MSSLLIGRFAVVTGGGSGIGRAVCQKFAYHGARLVVVDIHEYAAQETVKRISNSSEHTFFSCDVSNAQEVYALREFTHNYFKTSPSIVVNCAGITRDSTLLKMTEEGFDEVIAANLKSVYLVSQAFVKIALAQNSQISVVNVSSIVGKVGNFGQTNYAAAKAGVVGFSKSVAKELSKKGIRINTVLPGFIRTPMTAAMPENVLAKICAEIPMGRMGEDEEVADAILFLASDMAKYVTGATLEVTGGLYM